MSRAHILWFLFGITVAVSAKMDKKALQEHGLWDVSMHWNNDVYSGSHFDEIVTSPWSTDGVVMRSTVLLMYDESTWQDVIAYDLTTTGLPFGQHLRFLRYNYETTPKHIWFDLVKRDNLVSRYLYDNPTTINPEIFLFKKGSHIDHPVRFPIETVDFDEDALAFRRWIWQQLFTRFELNNYLGRRVKVSFDGDGPDTQTYELADDETAVVDAWVGKRMLITDKDGKKLLIGMVVAESADNAKFDLVKDNIKNFENTTVTDFLIDTHTRMQLEHDEDKRYSEWISMFYLKSFKQPVLLPKYSFGGYERRAMPDPLYDSLTAFYSSRRRKYADCVLGDGSKNGDEVKCRHIPLTNDYRIQIAHIVLPIAQKWAGVDLEMTYTYGVNEYEKDSIIKNGLGRVDDHVISAELVLFKDLGGKADWDLDIMDKHGKRNVLHLNAKEMLLYEGATTVQRRPRPFQGNLMVTVTVHFRPKKLWSWRYTHQETVFTDGKKSETLSVLNTPNTLRSMRKDEL